MRRLSTPQIALRLETVPGWARRGQTIYRVFAFDGFMDAVGFVNRVARRAEKDDHHPEIDIRWNKVSLGFTTHSKGGLTELDFEAAGHVSGIYSRFFASK